VKKAICEWHSPLFCRRVTGWVLSRLVFISAPCGNKNKLALLFVYLSARIAAKMNEILAFGQMYCWGKRTVTFLLF
jgi:hypothetical protein